MALAVVLLLVATLLSGAYVNDILADETIPSAVRVTVRFVPYLFAIGALFVALMIIYYSVKTG
jgi:hypothetical protein